MTKTFSSLGKYVYIIGMITSYDDENDDDEKQDEYKMLGGSPCQR